MSLGTLFTSSPLAQAGYSSTPTSTLDNSSTDSTNTVQDISSIISSVGQVVLGGLAISKLPNNTPASVSTQVAGRGTTSVVQQPTGILTPTLSGAFSSGGIILLLILAAVAFLILRKG